MVRPKGKKYEKIQWLKNAKIGEFLRMIRSFSSENFARSILGRLKAIQKIRNTWLSATRCSLSNTYTPIHKCTNSGGW